MPAPAFDQAIQNLVTAVARYYRCGSDFQQRSEAYWVFAAGSFSRGKYEEAVARAFMALPEMNSEEEDLRVARRLVVRAVKLLGKVDERDSMDLADAMECFEDCSML